MTGQAPLTLRQAIEDLQAIASEYPEFGDMPLVVQHEDGREFTVVEGTTAGGPFLVVDG